MRSHGMAPSAGSTQRKAGLLATALVLLLTLVLVAASASASESVALKFTFGPDGTSGTDFGNATRSAVDQDSGALYVIDQSAGSLYRFDADGNPLPFTGSAPYISGNAITGLVFSGYEQVAVDSQSHVFYVTSGNVVQAFHADGEEAEFTAGPGAGTNEISGFAFLSGLAVDSHGAIYALDFLEGDISIYTPSGEPLTRFETDVAPNALTVNSDGVVYVASYGIRKHTPSEFPVTTETTYAPRFGERIVTEWPEALVVDPVTDDLFAVQSSPPRVVRYDEDGNELDTFAGPGEEGELASGARGIAAGNDRFYVSNITQVEVFGTPPPAAPTVVTTSVADISASAAELRAEINPRGLTTSYRFEYGLGDCSSNPCATVPGASAISPGFLRVGVFGQVTGLQPGTTYHYRAIAENSLGTVFGPDRTFTTQVSGLGFELPDRRVWEMVSPPNKHGALLVGIGQGQIRQGQIQAAEDGNALAYLSINSIEKDPEGSRVFEPASALARRGTGGWRSEDIAAAYDRVMPVAGGSGTEYKFFSSDLSRALVHPRAATLLSPQASERTPYLRENTEPGYYVPLVTGKEGFANVPPGTEFGGDPEENVFPVGPLGATSDLDHVVLQSDVSLGSGPGLYRWSAGQLHPVSQLPAGEGGDMVTGKLGSELGSIRHAISENGSRIFWATGSYNASGIGLTALYLRDTPAEESVRLDLVQPGASGAGEPRPAFQGASSDGTVVYFTDSRQLTADASPGGRDLYRCEIPAGAGTAGCATLTDVSAPLPGSGESAMVKDISPALSEDGSRIYFVAEAVLDTEPNEEGDSAIAGEPNLYLYEEGEGVRFIATLSMDGRSTWGAVGGPSGGAAGEISASASPSGRYFVFMSERRLTGYDNREAKSDEPTEQAFRYDAASERLDCVSCNPFGAAPLGQRAEEPDSREQLINPNGLWTDQWLAASVPQATRAGIIAASFYRSRAVLDNGRIFFNAIDALVPADSNGEWDVYQWEPTGVGDCTASSGGASTSRSAGGCVSLISSGTGEEEVAFLDASATGDDVFFMTPARLSVLDKDSERDIYDARVDGVAATLPADTECLGEACQPAAIAPDDPTPASAGFKGQGDPKQSARKRCAKGKRIVRRKGKARCVARKHKRQGRAGTKRRASR